MKRKTKNPGTIKITCTHTGSMRLPRMLMPVTFQEFQIAITKRTEESFHKINDWSPIEYAAAMAGEVGEAVNFTKKIRRLQDGKHRVYNKGISEKALIKGLGKEIGDIVAYAAIEASRVGLDFETIVCDKFNEVSKRVGSKRRL